MSGRGKVSSGHGYSQMHWMRLSNTAANADSGSSASVNKAFPLNGLNADVDPLNNVISMAQLKKHSGRQKKMGFSFRFDDGKDCANNGSHDDVWMAVRGKVYNVTPYLKYHPGGEEQLLRGAGMDATKLFGREIAMKQ